VAPAPHLSNVNDAARRRANGGETMALESTDPTTWTIDTTHTETAFRVRHMMVSWTKGRFGAFSGTVTLDDAHPERSRIDVTIEAASVDTGLPDRDTHLRSPDFFDVEHHPHITFRSTSVRKIGDGAFTVLGDLTIRGVTRVVTLEVEGLSPAIADPWGGTRRGARAWANVDRSEFGLVWNGVLEAGGVLVGNEVRIDLDVELIQVAAEAKHAA
jgi:polyisoprenoid-binding protein YceI